MVWIIRAIKVICLPLFFVVLCMLCGCGTPTSQQTSAVSVTPLAAAVGPGQTVHFSAKSSDGKGVQWFVDGIPNGNSLLGTIDSTGMFTAPSQPARNTVVLMAVSQSNHPAQAAATVHVITPGQVAATSHPLVANYAINLPTGAQGFVRFGPDTTYGQKTGTQPSSPTGGETDFLVAGMKAFTPYHMQLVVDFADGSHFMDQDHVFTTGGPLPADVPNIAMNSPSAQGPQPGIELFDLVGTTSFPVFATDLGGNLIWWYKPLDGSPSDIVQPIQMLPNGHFLVCFGPGSTDNLGGVVEPSGTIRVLREIDLAGNTIHEISVDDVNARLAARGFSMKIDFMHHDVIALPNGHWIVIANEIKLFTDLPGFPGTLKVLGDDLIDLDTNLQPVWTWSTFDHLDVNRHPFQFPDWTHSNAVVYLPQDGNLLLSIRHQDWIIKIDYKNGTGAGDILWRLGKDGDFTLVGGVDPTDWFFAQHGPKLFSTQSATRYSLSVMDNGDDRQFPGGQTCATAGITPCPYSTVGIYDIDEVAKTATIAFHTTIPDFASFGGNTTVLANGNLEFDLCALTATPGHSIVREVDPRVGTQTVWELNVARFAYRAFRLPSLYPGVQW